MSPSATAASKPILQGAETVSPASVDSRGDRSPIDLSSSDGISPSNSTRCNFEESPFSSTKRINSPSMAFAPVIDVISSSSNQLELQKSTSGCHSSASLDSGKSSEGYSYCSVQPTAVSVQPVVKPAPHHQQEALCVTRPRYRQGRKLTAVKVYTVADESIYLLINGVPSVSLVKELKHLCLKRGKLLELRTLSGYPKEAFTDVFLVKYECLKQARLAKKFLDGRNFFGGILHVCYAPELETIEETRKKLLERRLTVNQAIAKNEDNSKGSILAQYHPQDKLTASIKRISHRLKCDDDILQLNSGQLSTKNRAKLEGDVGTIKSNDAEVVSGDWIHREHNNKSISVEKPYSLESNSCHGYETDYCRAGLGTSGIPNGKLEFARPSLNDFSNIGNGSSSDPRCSKLNCEKSEECFPDSFSSQTIMFESHTSSLLGPALGHTYASMDSDYELGIDRISSENYDNASSLGSSKYCEQNIRSNPKTKKKGWMEISNEIKKKKRKVQPRLNRLHTQTHRYCSTLEGGRELKNSPSLNIKKSLEANSNVFCDVNPTENRPTHFTGGSTSTASVQLLGKVTRTAKSDGNMEGASPKTSLGLKRSMSASVQLHKIGLTTHLRNDNRMPSESNKFQYLAAIRAAASTSFGPVPATAIRKVLQRPIPKVSLAEGVKLV